jgi:hypothetical protein
VKRTAGYGFKLRPLSSRLASGDGDTRAESNVSRGTPRQEVGPIAFHDSIAHEQSRCLALRMVTMLSVAFLTNQTTYM